MPCLPKLNKKGQSLLEIVLAVSIVVIVVYALVALATTSMRFAQSALRRSEAVKLANAGMEAFRLERDTGTGGFNSTELGATNTTQTYTICASSCDGHFIKKIVSTGGFEAIALRDNVVYNRRMAVEDDGSTRKYVRVTVKWQEGAGERKVSLSGILTNWR